MYGEHVRWQPVVSPRSHGGHGGFFFYHPEPPQLLWGIRIAGI